MSQSITTRYQQYQITNNFGTRKPLFNCTSVKTQFKSTLPNFDQLKDICKKQIAPLKQDYNIVKGISGPTCGNYQHYCLLRISKTVYSKYKNLTDENISKIITFFESLNIKDINAHEFIEGLIQFAQPDFHWFQKEGFPSKKMREIIEAFSGSDFETLRMGEIEPLDFSVLSTHAQQEFETALNANFSEKLISILVQYGYESIGETLIKRALLTSISLNYKDNVCFLNNPALFNKVGLLFPTECMDNHIFSKFLKNMEKLLKNNLYCDANVINTDIFYFMDVVYKYGYFASNVNTGLVHSLFSTSLALFQILNYWKNQKITFAHAVFKGFTFQEFLIKFFGVDKIGKKNIQTYFDLCTEITNSKVNIDGSIDYEFSDFFAAIKILWHCNSQNKLYFLNIENLEKIYIFIQKKPNNMLMNIEIDELKYLEICIEKYIKSYKSKLETSVKYKEDLG